MKGLIEGAKAREYSKKVGTLARSKVFDSFIVNNIKKNSKICDLCCGSGISLALLEKDADELVGIDGSEEMIRICYEKFGQNRKINLILSSATNLKLKSNSFDYVILRMGLHHIKNKAAVIAEVYRILKPAGKFILIDKYYTNVFAYYAKELSHLVFKLNTRLLNHFIISKRNVFALLDHFTIIKEEYVSEPKDKTTQTFMFVLVKK
jgi:ubiquinone/menaquinone biosynthesis C-methylase UbiE